MQAESGHALSSSEIAHRKRVEKDLNVQWETLQLQLEQVDKKNHDLIKSRKALSDSLEKKTRECSFFQKQCLEQQKELQTIRAQLEATTKINSLGPKGKALHAMGVTSFQDAKNINQTLDQLKNAKDDNEHLQKTLASTQQELQEKSLRVKVLEDALAFRSEEIGLAGHADLLAKVAQLKGEVRALKDELSDKTTRMSTIQEDKSRLSTEHESLQQQIQAIQERLAKSQQEAYKYANSDLGILLKSVEQERDVLLDYIQQDMEKSASLARQVEKLESDLRVAKRKETTSGDDIKALKDEIARLSKELETATKENEKLKQDNGALFTQNDQLKHNCESFQYQLAHKGREEDEIMKHQVSLFAQLRTKDEELMRKTEEIISLRAKVQEYDIAFPPLKNESDHMKEQIASLESEAVVFKKKSIELESDNRALTATLQRIEQENKHLQTRCQEQSLELQELRPYKLLVDDLDNDLDGEANGDDDHREDSFLSPGTPFSHLKRSPNNDPFNALVTPSKDFDVRSPIGNEIVNQLTVQARSASKTAHIDTVAVTPAAGRSKKSNAGQTNHLTLSQQHSLWIGLPSIRKLHPRLYEKIRLLAQDLHRKETEYSDLHHKYERLLSESTVDGKEAEGRIAYLTMCHTSDEEKISALTGKLHAVESEYYALKDAKTCLNQIRTVIATLSEHPLMEEANESDFVVKSDEETLSWQGLHHFPRDLDKVADTSLPSLVQDIFSANAQAVLVLRDTMDRCRRLTTENKDLTIKATHYSKENTDLTHRVTVLEEDLAGKNKKLQATEEDVQQQLDIAAELAEKQNALMMSLEAKVSDAYVCTAEKEMVLTHTRGSGVDYCTCTDRKFTS